MGLISSTEFKTTREGRPVADEKIQKDDLIEENNAGQKVVVVPAGSPVPDDDEIARRRRFGSVTVNGTDEQVEQARKGEPVDQPTIQTRSSKRKK